MALFGSTETVRAQAPQSPAMKIAWDYITELLQPGSVVGRRVAALPVGASEKHDLGGGVFAIEQVYQTKPRAEGFFESHRKMIDLQVVVAGQEAMEVVDVSRATVRDPYQDARDLIAYQDVADATVLRLRDREVAVFYPADVHMPSLRAGSEPVLVRKSVVKVPVGA